MTGQRVVRVLFGQKVVAEYKADEVAARGYAAAMYQRYPGLRITNDPFSDETPELRRMPGERLWAPEPAVA